MNQYAIPESAPGITRHATLARLMEERQGVRTTIISGDGHYWNLGDAGYAASSMFRPLPVHVAPSNGVRRVLNMLHFAWRTLLLGVRTPRRERPDVVLGSSPHLFGALAALLVARRFRVPFALEVRDIWPLSLVELMGMSPRHPLVLLMNVVERLLYRSADLILLVLPGSEAHIRDVCRNPPRMVRVPNGVDAATASTDEPRLTATTGPVSVAYAGAHGVPNALDTLIDAWAIIERDEDAPEMSLTLVGDGKQKDALRRMASDRHLRHVTFGDPIPKAEVPAMLRAADILVITWRDSPLYRHGISPNKLYDYMAAQRPVVIAVDTPMNPVIESGGGLSVPPEQPADLAAALVSLARADVAERDALGRRGRDYVAEHHDLRVIADRMAAELDALTRPDGGRAFG
ncbi:glycosyltransferase family 4 protein [Nocardioides hankookensis]|uniref:Glycosyltransferase family 4 protein n=1 Tax=Nocardioides hankookensis TaxID=443157 RepID=A0ABW1LD82_9ACTN